MARKFRAAEEQMLTPFSMLVVYMIQIDENKRLGDLVRMLIAEISSRFLRRINK